MSSKHSMSRDDLAQLIRDTGGKKTLDWYSAKSSYSLKTVSEVKQRIGYSKQYSRDVSGSEFFKSIYRFASQQMVSSDKQDEDGIRDTVAAVRERYPDVTKYQLKLVRKMLLEAWTESPAIAVDSHSGFLQALRLPLGRIAEVLQ